MCLLVTCWPALGFFCVCVKFKTHSFIHSFIQQRLTELLGDVRCCATCWAYRGEQMDKGPALVEMFGGAGQTVNK